MNTEIKIDLRWFVFFLAIPLFMQHAWVEGMFYDGHLYAAFGKNAVEKGRWLVPHLMDSAYPQFSQHPPFIFILEGLFFKVFGVSVTSSRVFISLFSLMTMGLLYRVSKNESNEDKNKLFPIIISLFFILIPALLKKSRFPNMDIPLTLFVLGALYSYYKAQIRNTNQLWAICGVFFGLSLLTKGAMGMLIPAGIGFHILFTNSWKNLKRIGFWGAVAIGIAIFSIWPISLSVTGKYFIFQEYIGYVFGLGNGEYAQGFHSPFYTYPLFLIKQTPHLFIPFVYGLIRWLKHKEINQYVAFSYSVFFGMMTLLSFSSVKLSNYLLPLYPFYAICAAWGAKPFIEKHFNKFKKTIILLAIATPLVLLIFPLTNYSKRDRSLYKTLDVLVDANKVSLVRDWYVVEDAYPFWNVANFVGWKGLGNVHAIELKSFLNSSEDKDGVWILSEKNYDSLPENIASKYTQIYFSKKKKITLLVKKNLLDETPLVEDFK